MTRENIITGLLLLLLGGGILFGAYSLATNGTDYHYEYTVKAEQVNEDEMVNESVAYDNVSDAEQEVLFDAFKKSDHFLGGADAQIHTDQPIDNVSNEWRVIEIKGVPMLVSIEGPDKDITPGESGDRFLFFIAVIVGLFILLWGLGTLIFGPPDAKRTHHKY